MGGLASLSVPAVAMSGMEDGAAWGPPPNCAADTDLRQALHGFPREIGGINKTKKGWERVRGAISGRTDGGSP